MKKVLIHYGTPGMHWGDRKYQYEDGSLTPAGRERYLKGAKERAERQFDMDIGSSSTLARQQKRYLEWARIDETRSKNTNRNLRGEYARKEILARKNEAKLYSAGLRHLFKSMRDYKSESVPRDYYNEDAIAQVWNSVYSERVIEPAWNIYNKAIKKAKNNQNGEEFAKFVSNEEHMTKYGYSKELSIEAYELGLSMETLAYANWLIEKDKYD